MPALRRKDSAVIWDVDGTLVDTSDLHYQAWVQLTQERGLPFTRDDFESTFGRRNPEIIRELFGDHLSAEAIAEIGDAKEALYREAARKGITLLEGVRKLLTDLHSAGWRQAVGSSAPRTNIELILDITAVRSFFTAIVGMEDCSHGKPHPEVFLNAAAQLDVAPANCIVIEDAAAGVQAAKAGGMKCIAVYGAGHHSPDGLREVGADVVVESMREIDLERVAQLIA